MSLIANGAMITPGPPEQQAKPLPLKEARAEGSTSLVPAFQEPPESPTSTRRRPWWLWVVGAAIAAVVGGLIYLQPWMPAQLPVAVEQASAAPVTRLLAVNGRIAALHSVDVRALVGGPVTQVAVTEGQAVDVGQVLARIDATTQNAIVRQAFAGLDAALVAQEQANAIYERSLALRGNISVAALEADQRAAQSAKQEVARMTALLEQAQEQLARYTVTAPITGTIVTLDVEPGQIADTTTVLMTLADLGKLVVETDVDEAYATQIGVGQQAVLNLPGEAKTRTGRVRTVAGRVDAATGGLAVTVDFDAPVSAPLGLTVTANIIVEQRDSALTVPRTALVTDESGTAIFVAQDGIARRQTVSVIDWPAARLLVTEGLSPGERVIIDATGVSDGLPVKVGAP